MIIRSIYEEMEKSAAFIPGNVNVKLVFRHSIRPSLKGCDNPDEVPLTQEGVCLARFFGREIGMEIGFVGTNRAQRCCETVARMLEARHQDTNIIVISDALSLSYVKDSALLKTSTSGKMSLKNLVLKNNKGEIIPGMNSLEDSVRGILDYIFSVGNRVNMLDLFCTHDFQIMMIASLLFTRYVTREEIEGNWPRMLEGVFFWGERNDFYCSWRGEIKHYLDF